jgi:DNA-binding XRE family transcriptional regulator
MGAGRPTEYCQEVQEAAERYASGGFKDCGDIVPSRSGLALELGVSRQTLINWEKHPEFLDTLNKIGSYQERISLNGGLNGTLNPTIVKLLLANHGYSDKIQQDNTSSDGSMSPKHNVTVQLVKADGANQSTDS